ncbi:MAG: hypothetical protein ACKVJX_01950 [Verrucomicrobiia bacterium]
MGSRARLAAITKDLISRWKEVKEHWRDSKAAEFEKAYLEELLISVNTAVGSLEKLDQILTKIRKDCE